MPKKKTHEEFVDEVKMVTNGEYSVLGTYVNNMTKVLIKHNKCNNEWSISRANFINHGKRCPKCKGKSLSEKFSKTHKEFINEIHNLYKEEYEIISEYKNSYKKIEVVHKKCGHKYSVRPTNLLQGKNCPICKWGIISKKRSKGLEQFKKDVSDKVGNEYEIIGEYISNKIKTKIKHNCGYIYEGTPDNFLRGNRCPKCSSSKGENSIHEYLISNNVNYKSQYKFDDCKYKSPLPFDFAVFNNDGSLKLLIEYDGLQHFQPVEYFGGIKEFKDILIRDKIKSDYCFANNIKLIRIAYWDYNNISSILDDDLY